MRITARDKYGTQGPHSEDDAEKQKPVTESKMEHVNFFADEEAGLVSGNAVNKEHEEEQKQEKEKYEKQIGYLTYLGQDTNEATGKVSWYNKCPERDEPGLTPNEETGLKHKMKSDPLHSFRKYCSSTFSKAPASHTTSRASSSESKKLIPNNKKRERSNSPKRSQESKKHRHDKKKKEKERKHKSSHSSKSKSVKNYDDSTSDSQTEDDNSDHEDEKKSKLEKLRAERLRREKEEKKKAEKLLAKINGVAYIDEDEKPQPKIVMKQRYNSQFNPYIAKQNFDDQRYRF